jgi:hypothetical protein
MAVELSRVPVDGVGLILSGPEDWVARARPGRGAGGGGNGVQILVGSGAAPSASLSSGARGERG